MEVKQELIQVDINMSKGKEVTGQATLAPSSCDNADSGQASGGNTNSERQERRKKTRRGKPKGKTFKPYNKVPRNLEMKSKRARQKGTNSRLTYDQPEAPNNSNQFLIEDHNFDQIPDLSPKTGAMLTHISHRKCNRDSSFTSVESDGDNFYSSPEDEEEFLTKEFSETYKDLQEESLSNMSKNELIRQILSLEEKVEMLAKKWKSNDVQEDTSSTVLPQEKMEILECENSWLKREVERLNTENNLLRRRCHSSNSSIDSESDSSSSSSSDSSSSSSQSPSPTSEIQLNDMVHENEAVTQMEEDHLPNEINNRPKEIPNAICKSPDAQDEYKDTSLNST